MKYFFLLWLLLPISLPLLAQSYDVVLNNGRVMDPATEFDAIRNVGIIGDRIAIITEEQIQGVRTIDCSGLVVSPGFIDLHVHGMTNEAHEYQMHDGVTTALELESGVLFLDAWMKNKAGKALVNFGATVPHAALRAAAMPAYQSQFKEARAQMSSKGYSQMAAQNLSIKSSRSIHQSLRYEQMNELEDLLVEELKAGGLGIGVPVGYYPGATGAELLAVYRVASEYEVPVFSHTRGFGLEGINEAIANATVTGAPLHIVHANSLSLSEIQVTLDMVRSAQNQGLDVTTEVYPYTAASTSLQSVLFDEGWKEDLGISYGDLQWEDTGERLTSETFYEYREKGGTVIIHMMKPEWIAKGIADDRTMIGSDGMPYHPKAHPRTAGTFSRVLGKYVRQDGVTDLMSALAKMTIMPANRLEQVAPSMLHKGRLQMDADADITVFDPDRIIDKATFEGLQFSEGIEFVLVNGKLVVDQGKTVGDTFPGKPIYGKYRRNKQ